MYSVLFIEERGSAKQSQIPYGHKDCSHQVDTEHVKPLVCKKNVSDDLLAVHGQKKFSQRKSQVLNDNQSGAKPLAV